MAAVARLHPHFYPRPPCGGRRIRNPLAASSIGFLSTSPLRGTTFRRLIGCDEQPISIHVPLAGDDCDRAYQGSISWHFYPRPPCGGRRGQLGLRTVVLVISIHVPLAGDDPRFHYPLDAFADFYPRPPCGGRLAAALSGLFADDFYPRPPCGGRRDGPHHRLEGLKIFLSTSPLRGTTGLNEVLFSAILYFYPRPPCGGRPPRKETSMPDGTISIHVPLAGDDLYHGGTK